MYTCLMRDKWKLTHHLPKNAWNCKLNYSLFPPLGGFSPFSRWPLIFHFSSATSLVRHRHLHHVCSFPPQLLHSTRFTQCWSLNNLHVAPTIFSQLFSFLYFVVFLRDNYDVAFNPISIFDCSKLSLIVEWETIWGTKVGGWPPCLNKGIRMRNPNYPHIEVVSQYYRKYSSPNKFKYDYINSKWIDVDCVISTVTMSYKFTHEVYTLDMSDFEQLSKFVTPLPLVCAIYYMRLNKLELFILYMILVNKGQNECLDIIDH